ncbi:hypothetical protein K2173_016565 [Erythroxylum novogranatense]|uniref:Trichome birefringence-like N-terminal domain-containing protein n=1 Tax=Erythroxylum novogranatense TaxID=1862640 RepID=A0AAV8SH89_9ROSI|nr:hypothetical protein K2173_016565 [Erythroxylum novogranatense]
MASNSSRKSRYTLTTSLFLVLFLLTIFLFSKRALEPALVIYRDFFPLSSVHLSSPDSATPPQWSSDEVEGAESLSNQLKSSIFEAQAVESKDGLGYVDGKLSPDNVKGSDSDLDPVGPTVANGDGTLTKSTRESGINDPDSVEAAAVKVDNGGDHLMQSHEERETNTGLHSAKAVAATVDVVDDKLTKSVKECDLYMGTWVRDGGYPIYKPGSCPFVDEAFDCQSNGRRDSDYLKWRWKPDGCDLPRFNATDFLRRLRGKRLMLVGDSMNRNQFESLLCLLREGLHDKRRMYEVHGHKITKGRGYYIFKFMDYDCTVEFVRSHFLVREGLRINGQGNSNPTLSIDRIDKTSSRWKRANILVFNTGHWWTHGKTARGKNYYKEGNYLYPQFDAVEAYRRALRTWAKWIDDNVNSKKQLVFYRGYSSAHFRGGDWDSGGSCNGEGEPVLGGAILNNYPLKMKIVEEAIQGMRTPVKLLNVTRLTNFRKDGHPSIYGKNLTAGKRVSTRRQDCSHWCLPGVPDAWNELIYASLVFQQKDSYS